MAGAKRVSINDGMIHSAMALHRQLPSVCRALGAHKFCDEYELALISRSGPQSAASVTFTFSTQPHLECGMARNRPGRPKWQRLITRSGGRSRTRRAYELRHGSFE